MRPRLVLLLALLAPWPCLAGEEQGPTALAPRTVTVLAINDVYRIEGLEGGEVGGIARVRALRAELEREDPELLVVHAGDLLFPSFASRRYKGAQMVDVLNRLDGAPKRFDPRFFVTFGNHEFDLKRCDQAADLGRRVAEAEFRWLSGNVVFAETADGRPLVGGDNVVRSAIVEANGLKVGLFGLTIPTDGVQYIKEFLGPTATARGLVRGLRQQGAEVVIGVTHLEVGDDLDLLRDLGAEAPDLILGGHEHEKRVCAANGRLVIKADADARTATVARLTRHPDGRVEVRHELRTLSGHAPAPDPAVEGAVQGWQQRLSREFCAAEGQGPDCLDQALAPTTTLLEGEETKVRSRETGLGDYLTDLMRTGFAPCAAQVAFLNSGSLRLNQDLPAGTVLTRRHLEELLQYETKLLLLRIPGSTLIQVAEHAARGWPGTGSWLQISGFTFEHDPTGRTVRNVSLLTPEGPRAVRPSEEILAVTNQFLVDPAQGDQDGYQMLGLAQVVSDCSVNGLDLKKRALEAIAASAPQGIAPVTDGRILQPELEAGVGLCGGTTY